MKRKIALLLATVMTLSMLPMNLFAASSNHFTKTPTTVPDQTLLYEENFPGLDGNGSTIPGVVTGTPRTSGATLYDVHAKENKLGYDLDLGDADYAVEGSNFVITPSDVVRSGDTFRVRLENAKWFFRSTSTASTSSNADLAKMVDRLNTSGAALGFKYDETDALSTEDYISKTNAREYADGFGVSETLGMTYDVRNGIWIPEANDVSGIYYRLNNSPMTDISNEAAQIPYKLTVSPLDDSVATIEILGDTINGRKSYAPGKYADGYNDIVIPLVALATEEKDVKLKIESSLTGVSSGTYIYGIAGGGSTTTKVDDPQDGREEFEINQLIIDETRIASLEEQGSVQITLPNGFSWADVDKAKVYVDTGVEWGHSNTNAGIRDTTYDSEEIMHWLAYSELNHNNKRHDTFSEQIKSGADYALGYDFIENSYNDKNNSYHDYNVGGHFEIDDQTIVLSVNDFKSSDKVRGAIYIEGLTVLADEDAPMGVFNLSIKDVKDDELGVTKQTNVKAGNRVDYGVTLKLQDGETVPTLISGRYEDKNTEYFDDYQQTASIEIAETTVNSWWSGRTTTLTLPEKVRFAQVEITDGGEFTTADQLEAGVSAYDGYYRNDGRKYGYVTVDNNVMTFTNLKVNDGETGSMEMDLWVSIAADFEGDVKLVGGGSAITGDKTPSVVIAKAIAPVKIETKTSDIKVGYQYQQTSEIKVTETKAGNLLRGKRMNLSVTDLVSTDMSFSPSTEIKVTEGDLKIKNITTTGSGSWGTGLSQTSNAVSFDIDKASTKASTVTLSNVSVKIDRSVPVSNNRPYDVVAWGSAVAQNFDSTSTANKDEFSIPGVTANYIRVVSSATDSSDILSQEVRVTIGERNYTVNGKVMEMDAAAYISTKSNSTMVPLRFVANAFGLRDDQIIWDDVTKTVTLNAPNKVVQFMVGSQMMNVEGAAITMLSPDGLAVTAENVNSRVYVPFRQLGQAFGVKVDWENNNTAVYNKGAALVANGAAPAATTPAAQ